jgi:hypothetical protein
MRDKQYIQMVRMNNQFKANLNRFFMRNLFIFLLLPLGVFAQSSMHVSDPLSIRNDYGYELIGRLRDRILVFRDKYDEFEIQAYDQQMRPVWNRELEDLDKRGVQILAVTAGKNDFSVLYRWRRRGHIALRLHKYDPGANLIDTATIKDYGERVFNVPELKHIESEDRNCMVVYNEAEPGRMEATCFRVDKMVVLWDKIVPSNDIDTETNARELLLSNDGIFCIVEEKNNRKGKIEDHRFDITYLKNAPEWPPTFIAVPHFLTGDVAFKYNNEQQSIVGAGVYGEKNRERVNGSFFISMPVASAITATVRIEPFDDHFLSIVRRKTTARALSMPPCRSSYCGAMGGCC